MFSLQCSGSFTPVYNDWVFYDSSFCSLEKSNIIDQREKKSTFSPILIAPPVKPEEKIIEESSSQTKIQRKQVAIQRCQTQDEEYTPGISQGKKTKKNQQNENRNIMPNIVNQILSFIQKKNKSENITAKIMDKLNTKSEWSVKRFYIYQTMLKNKISHYVNEQTMKIFMKTSNVDVSIYSQDEQEFYNKISRILTFYFLETEAQTSTLTSKRMDKSKKAAHIRIQGQLAQKLRQIYKLD